LKPAPVRQPAGEDWSPAWKDWFSQVVACLPFSRSYNYTFTIDFGNVLANTQSAATTVTIPGVKQGDSVHVTPLADTVGIIPKGVVTADDTVSVFVCNFTAGAINPASTVYRVVVIQN
jgi:hypothetical protein